MKLKAFFAWRIAAIRRRVTRSPRFQKLDWTPDAAIGFACGFVAAIVFGSSEPGLVFGISAILLGASVLYTGFALIVQFLAYSEWGDRVYDNVTKKSLSADYQKTRSATGSRRRRKTRKP